MGEGGVKAKIRGCVLESMRTCEVAAMARQITIWRHELIPLQMMVIGYPVTVQWVMGKGK